MKLKHPAYLRLCINRNIVECKAIQVGRRNITASVLIETLWNVKWQCGDGTFPCFRSINRNIVECKVINFGINYFCHLVLIETLWNVKTDLNKNTCHGYFVLIETLWNVKYYIVLCKKNEMKKTRLFSSIMNENNLVLQV